jgi:phosphatidylinositol alpha-1,6-mannosyltransferase
MSDAKKILLFTLEYPPFKGGVANYYGYLVKYWPQPENIFVLNNNKNKLININLPILKWLPAFFELKKAVSKNKIDHIIVGNILPLGIVLLILIKFFNIKFSIILHGTDIAYAQKSKRKKWLAGQIFLKAENIICNSTFTSGLIKDYYDNYKKKVIIINPGIDTALQISNIDEQKIKFKYNLDDKIILFSLSRLIRRKGIDKVIESLPEILNKIDNLVYVIAGTGPDEHELKIRAAELIKKIPSLKNKIIFLGKISEEAKWAWLSISDIFILPSREEDGNLEGFGIVYLEASLAGKPVIAGNHGGVSDAVIGHKTGLLVNPQSEQEIQQAILKLVKDKDLRIKLGEQGRKRVMNEFDWKWQVGKIYKSINLE